MKKIILGFLCLMFASILSAKQINVELAELIASKHINTKVKQQNTRSKLLTLVHIEQNNDKLKNITKNYYYVFNIGNQNGFIIISADDINVPIIGYSTEGSYNPNDLPDNFKAWMKNIVNGMERALDEDFSDPHTYKIWNKYISDEITLTTRDASSRLAPLIKTKWNQNKPYNILIPITSSNGTNIYYPYTGCVATAMAQIMKFHNHPVKGTTTIPSYNSGSYPIPEIQSENLVYDWDNMLNIYYDNETETEKNAVAKLMFHY